MEEILHRLRGRAEISVSHRAPAGTLSRDLDEGDFLVALLPLDQRIIHRRPVWMGGPLDAQGEGDGRSLRFLRESRGARHARGSREHRSSRAW